MPLIIATAVDWMRRRAENVVAGLLGLIHEGLDRRSQSLLEQRDPSSQVKPQVYRHLLVT